MHSFLTKICSFVQLLIVLILLKFFPQKISNNGSFIADNATKGFALFVVSLFTNNLNANLNMVRLKNNRNSIKNAQNVRKNILKRKDVILFNVRSAR